MDFDAEIKKEKTILMMIEIIAILISLMFMSLCFYIVFFCENAALYSTICVIGSAINAHVSFRVRRNLRERIDSLLDEKSKKL